MSLFLQLDEKSIPAIASFSFLYSAWATIGLVPLCLYAVFKNGRASFRRALTWQNFTFTGILLFTLGPLYMGTSATSGFLSGPLPEDPVNHLVRYALFLLLEVGVFLLALGKTGRHYPYYYVVVGELMLCHLLHFVNSNCDMRSSIPALFLLCLYCMRFLLTSDHKLALRKVFLTIFLCLGALTALSEGGRSLKETAGGTTVYMPLGASFEDIQTDDESFPLIFAKQFFVYDYEQTFFFQYLAK